MSTRFIGGNTYEGKMGESYRGLGERSHCEAGQNPMEEKKKEINLGRKYIRL